MGLFSFLKSQPSVSSLKPVVLLVLDGYGIAPASAGNAITQARTPFMDNLLNSYPHTELIASGESVGLPANEVGNTEVGHLTLGAGRVIYQDLKRISMAIEDSTFFDNKAFLHALAHCRKYNSKMHLMGLVGTGNVHSSIEHFYALLQFFKKAEFANVFLHLFTDGRDTPPKEAIEIINKIETYTLNNKIGHIASISGRYYAMDRDRRWDRTEKAYKAIVLGKGQTAMSAQDAVESAYARGLTDEFIEPCVIMPAGRPVATVDDNDAVIFFNFRVDRPRQLTMAFVLPDFEKLTSFEFGYAPGTELEEGKSTFRATFQREKWARNIFFVTMTEYHKKLRVSEIAFGPQVVTDSLGAVIASANLKQMHMAESEKERFVTYYFDGMNEKPPPGEEVCIVASPKVPTYDRKPEMSVFKLVGEFKKHLAKGVYSFFVVNFANPDMVAHTGNLKATIKAVEAVDKAVEEFVEAVMRVGGTLVLTADHGNAEELLTYETTSFFFTTGGGKVNTEHSNNPVPVVIINSRYAGRGVALAKGSLADIAPTALALMGLTPPRTMTGRNLLTLAAQSGKPS
jgi:2,3-bisphosphoglycerate-independent phosphoglycerate mutase